MRWSEEERENRNLGKRRYNRLGNWTEMVRRGYVMRREGVAEDLRSGCDKALRRIDVVVRNEDELVLGSCIKRLSQAYDAMEIEAMAAAIALFFASELGVREAILERDSMAVIKALKEFEEMLSPTGLLLEDIRMFSQRCDALFYFHTKREGNSIAHSLARYALSIPDFLVWIKDVPTHIQHFVQADLVSLS
ncbi:uncharacterized protein LOC142608714 [Castanea sativa]|uniref:uncharacterized protein LOC142608714 n=1 Tax=Castanea sativa TaxID=21020 RepID=UPI003F6537D3